MSSGTSPVNPIKTKIALPLIDLSGQSAEKSKQKGLRELTTREVQTTESQRVTKPIDLTREMLREIGLDSPLAQLQRGVVRIRVVLNGKTIGSGSGSIISSDGLVWSNNHVPALGQQGNDPFSFLPGRDVLKNLRTWSELLRKDGKGEAKLVCDLPLLPEVEPPKTIFTPGKGEIKSLTGGSEQLKKLACDEDERATEYHNESDTIDYVIFDARIIDEYPEGDLALFRIGNAQDPKKNPYINGFPFVKITDVLPEATSDVYSIGHPGGIPHNALSLGTCFDSDFTIDRIKGLSDAHAKVLAGILGIFGKGFDSKEFEEAVSEAFPVLNASLDFEPARPLIDGGNISDVNIAPGSSGGFLGNENLEQVGITYLNAGAIVALLNPPFGYLYFFNPQLGSAYISGALGFTRNDGEAIKRLSGSIGMKKAIPFLQRNRIDVSQIRDGKPADVDTAEARAAVNRARVSMAQAYRAQKPDISEDEIERRLENAGFPKEIEPPAKQKPAESQTEKKRYHICGVELTSKPKEIIHFEVKPNTKDESQATKIKIKAKIATEKKPKGETIKLEVSPNDFKLERDIDPDTKGLVIAYLFRNGEVFKELSRVQELVQRNTDTELGGKLRDLFTTPIPSFKPLDIPDTPKSDDLKRMIIKITGADPDKSDPQPPEPTTAT